MNLNQMFYSIATCCLLMAIFVISKVSAYSEYNESCHTDMEGNCITYLRSIDEVVIMDELFREGRNRIRGGRGTLSSRDVKRYETARIYDFRNRDIAQVINIEYLENDRLPVILFNVTSNSKVSEINLHF